MAPAIVRLRRLLAPAAALLAMGVLAAMVVSGHLRESRQLVKFAPAGVMSEAPAEIDRVELRTSTGSWVFVHGPDGYLRVDYDALGLPFQTFDEWTASSKAKEIAASARP